MFTHIVKEGDIIEGKNKIRKTAGTVSLILIILIPGGFSA